MTEDRYFEDYVPGAVFEYGEIRVDEAEILDFARRFDPQDMHVDPEAARRGRFGGLIASGWHTGAMMMRLLADNFLPKGASLASPGIDELPSSNSARQSAETIDRAVGPGWEAPFVLVAATERGPITTHDNLALLARWQRRMLPGSCRASRAITK